MAISWGGLHAAVAASLLLAAGQPPPSSNGGPPGAPHGPFPAGCRWRESAAGGRREYWREEQRAWAPEPLPEACLVRGLARPKRHQWHDGTPHSQLSCTNEYCSCRNLWYNNGQWYVIVKDSNPVRNFMISRNQEIRAVHFSEPSKFVNAVRWRVVPGATLLYDYVYFLHPNAIGHWLEFVAPLFSVLRRDNTGFPTPPRQCVLLRMKRSHMGPWVRSTLSLAVGAPPEGPLPPLMFQQETEGIYGQLCMQNQSCLRCDL
eukprot:evm.model.scf_234.9 EVM.evm.TU.scf_234.9   scf_234:88282-93161(-)